MVNYKKEFEEVKDALDPQKVIISINQIGEEKTWERIEQMDNPFIRCYLRSIFLAEIKRRMK